MLDPALAARINGLALRARLIVEGALTGHHRSRLHGASVEFSQHKEYSPGDEIRHIDWKTYAKADRYYVKQFEQESQLTAYMLLDASGSMAFNGGSEDTKFAYAGQLVGALSYLLVRQQDHVGLRIFGDSQGRRFIPPRTRASHLREIFSMIVQVADAGANGVEVASTVLQEIVQKGYQRRSLIVLVSDLLNADEETMALLRRLRARSHDIVVFQVMDPHELEFPYDGMTLFSALEGNQRLLVHPSSVRAQYKKRLAAFLKFVEAECVNSGIAHFLVSTATPMETVLRDFVEQRNRR